MRARGLEPPRPSGHRLLRPACLPVPPRPRGANQPTRLVRHAHRSAEHGWSSPARPDTRPARACMVMWIMAANPERQPGVIITHPNRDKAVVQATRATVIVLLLASAGLVA